MYTIYNPHTGQIKRISETASFDIGESAIEGSFDGTQFYVKNGNAIPIPPKPNNETTFDFLIERWVDQAGLDTRQLIERRNRLLSESDWTQMPDVSLWNKPAWTTYRQALRDLTSQPGYPLDIQWPVKPASERNVIYRVGSI